MQQVLFKNEDRKSGVESTVSAIAVPGGIVLKTLTTQRENMSEATVFLPGVRVEDGKLVPVTPALVDYFDPNYLKNLVAEAVAAATTSLPVAGSQDYSALVDAAFAKLKTELPTPAQVVLPDFGALVAEAVSNLPQPAIPDVSAIVAAEIAKIPTPVVPDVAALVAAEVAKIPTPAAPQLPDFDALITEKVAAAVAAIPKPVEPAPTEAPAA